MQEPRAAYGRTGGERGRRRWSFWLTTAVGLLLFAWVVSRLSLPELADALRGADPAMLVAALACGLAATFFRCWRYRQLFADLLRDEGARGSTLYGAFAAMRLLHLALPLRTGEVAALGLLKQHRLSPSVAETLPVWLLLRLSDAVTLLVWMLAALLFLAERPGEWTLPQWIVWTLPAVAVAALGVAWIVVRWRTLRRSLSAPREGWLGGRLDAFRRGWRRLRGTGRLARVLVLAFLVSAAMIGIGTCAQLAFASPLPWTACWLLSAVVLGVSMLPIHGPLGLGTLEASWVGLMSLYGVAVPEAVAIALGIRLLTLGIVVVEGGVGWLLLAVSSSRGPRS